MRPGWYYSVLVVFGKDRIGVIDTGFESTLEEFVLPLIKEKGRDTSEINLVVNTHRDGDHVKGNQSFKDKTEATIMAHHLDRPARKETESLLLDLVAQGKARRIPLGNDAIWLATRLEQGRRAE